MGHATGRHVCTGRGTAFAAAVACSVGGWMQVVAASWVVPGSCAWLPNSCRVGWMPQAGQTMELVQACGWTAALLVWLRRAHGCPCWCTGCCVEWARRLCSVSFMRGSHCIMPPEQGSHRLCGSDSTVGLCVPLQTRPGYGDEHRDMNGLESKPL